MTEADDLKRLKVVMEDKALVPCNFDFWSLWLLCSSCQTTVTHPAIAEELRQQYRHLGKQLQTYITEYHPEVKDILDKGWYRHNDVTQPFSTLAPTRNLPVQRMGGNKRRRRRPT